MESRLVERGLVEFLLVETSFLGMISGNFNWWKFSFVEVNGVCKNVYEKYMGGGGLPPNRELENIALD